MKAPSSPQELIAELRQKGISNEAVLKAIALIPRHLFIDQSLREKAYWDSALTLSHGQTISQPYVVARMTELLLSSNKKMSKVLEIGTGSGYQAAILSKLVDQVYTVERIWALFEKANATLRSLNLTNIFTAFGDGHAGWNDKAPFDGIIVTAAAEEVPAKLLEQLADQGKMVIPVGGHEGQFLQIITREGESFSTRNYDAVVFVPFLKDIEK